MPGRPVGPARRILARQRRTAERLRREVMDADGSLRHPYFRGLDRRLRRFEGSATPGDLVAAAALADIVYVGDFHAVPACQTWTADLLEQLARRVPALALGVEFVYTRQQPLLDRRQAGTLADEAFLRRVRYEREWGYAWEGYRELLDRARGLGVPVHALDASPRRGFASLERRDEHAARRIASLLGGAPRTRLLVLFGESHLTPEHLPRRAKSWLKRAGLERRELVVFQNPDRLFWQASDGNGSPPGVLRVDGRTFAVFHTSPLEKYEAYRQVLERFRGDVAPDEEADLAPAAHHAIASLLEWLGIRASRRRLRHRAGWTDDLEDALPEVYSGAQATALLEPILREHGSSPTERREARRRLASGGAMYDPRSNAMFVLRYHPAVVGAEAARFLRTALTGRLYLTAADDSSADPAAAAYGAAYNEALARLGAGLLDSRWPTPWPKTARERAHPSLAPWVRAHHAFERSGNDRAPDALRRVLRRSRSLRRIIAHDLGRRLGSLLVARVRRGELDKAELRRLFTRPLRAEQMERVVMRLARRAVGSTAAAGR